ncbi:MAG: polyprenyl diphosphate synthase [Methanomicrobiales archaeon]|nr:polyprenyl diphosphate synthase [Methanomicrobiales archaeon]
MIFSNALQALYERILRSQCTHVPRHIAIIQDGNRRFAQNHGITRADGHRAGADTTEMMLDWANELGIRHITLYCFSTENFSRDYEEVKELIDLIRDRLIKAIKDRRIHRNQIRLQVLGDRTLLPDDLRVCVEEAERATAGYQNHFINLALAYGGRNEIVRAARELVQKVQEGSLEPEDIDAAMVEKHLDGGRKIPPVDLIIRTGNERRTSNFLPWFANGNECAVYFCAPNWPSFRKIDLLRAIRVYDQRICLKRETG